MKKAQQKLIPREQTYKSVLPFEEIVVFPTREEQRELAAQRAEKATTPWFDFSKAQDVSEDDRKWYNSKLRNFLRPKPANCINTATHWITNGATVANNQNLANSPIRFGYVPIKKEKAERGDLIQYVNEIDGEPYHAGIILENNHYVTAVRSSNGANKINPIREYDTNGVDTEDPNRDNITNANYYRYSYPYSGVYFRINGKLQK